MSVIEYIQALVNTLIDRDIINVDIIMFENEL